MATSTAWTSSCVRWLNGEEINVSKTICVLVFREMTRFTFEWYSLFKNGDTFSQKSKQYWQLSLMLRVWCIMNLFTGAITWMFTKQFCNAFKMFFRNYLANCFQYLDSSPQQCTLPSGPECQRCWPSCGFASSLPDLAPCAFFLFPRLKITLKREVLNEITEIQLNTTLQLQASLKQVYHRQWKVEGFSVISAYNLEDPTLEKIIQADLKML
jgi:hypothetical protein